MQRYSLVLLIRGSSRKFMCKALQSTHLLRVLAYPSPTPSHLLLLSAARLWGINSYFTVLASHSPGSAFFFFFSILQQRRHTFLHAFIDWFSSPCPQKSPSHLKRGVGIIRTGSPDGPLGPCVLLSALYGCPV